MPRTAARKKPSPSFPAGLKTVTIPGEAKLYRVHLAAHDPIWFGPAPGAPPAYRFDAPAGQHGTLYVAAALAGAFAETIARQARRRIIGVDYVALRSYSTIAATRPLTLAKLHGNGLLWYGVDAAIAAAASYKKSRKFALRIHDGFPTIDGIAYRARHDNDEICYALFERCAKAITVVGTPTAFSSMMPQVETILSQYGITLDTAPGVPHP